MQNKSIKFYSGAIVLATLALSLYSWGQGTRAQDSQKPAQKPAKVTASNPSSMVAFDARTRALLRSADFVNGARVSKDESCVDCHGQRGIAVPSDDPSYPSLAGMRIEYIFKQLMDYKTGKRKSEDMQPIVEEMDEKTLADLALFFSRQKPQPRTGKVKMTPALEKLILFGDPTRLLHACSSCHGVKGQGGQYDFPRISGQISGYFIKTMLDFKSGKRKNDVYSRMRLIAHALTEQEIKALAAYYAGLPVPPKE